MAAGWVAWLRVGWRGCGLGGVAAAAALARAGSTGQREWARGRGVPSRICPDQLYAERLLWRLCSDWGSIRPRSSGVTTQSGHRRRPRTLSRASSRASNRADQSQRAVTALGDARSRPTQLNICEISRQGGLSRPEEGRTRRHRSGPGMFQGRPAATETRGGHVATWPAARPPPPAAPRPRPPAARRPTATPPPPAPRPRPQGPAARGPPRPAASRVPRPACFPADGTAGLDAQPLSRGRERRGHAARGGPADYVAAGHRSVEAGGSAHIRGHSRVRAKRRRH